MWEIWVNEYSRRVNRYWMWTRAQEKDLFLGVVDCSLKKIRGLFSYFVSKYCSLEYQLQCLFPLTQRSFLLLMTIVISLIFCWSAFPITFQKCMCFAHFQLSFDAVSRKESIQVTACNYLQSITYGDSRLLPHLYPSVKDWRHFTSFCATRHLINVFESVTTRGTWSTWPNNYLALSFTSIYNPRAIHNNESNNKNNNKRRVISLEIVVELSHQIKIFFKRSCSSFLKQLFTFQMTVSLISTQ